MVILSEKEQQKLRRIELIEKRNIFIYIAIVIAIIIGIGSIIVSCLIIDKILRGLCILLSDELTKKITGRITNEVIRAAYGGLLVGISIMGFWKMKSEKVFYKIIKKLGLTKE